MDDIEQLEYRLRRTELFIETLHTRLQEAHEYKDRIRTEIRTIQNEAK